MTPPRFTRAWVDAFGSAYTTLEGGTGQRTVLVIARLEQARGALEVLSERSGFKGRVALAVVERAHEAPLLEVLRQVEPTAVIALEDVDGIALIGGQATTEAGEFVASTGLTYRESGIVPAWRSSVSCEGDLEMPSEMPCRAASLACERRVPALACGISSLESALNRF